jgi:hypothetical protein
VVEHNITEASPLFGMTARAMEVRGGRGRGGEGREGPWR